MIFIFTDTSFNARRIGSYRIASALRKIDVDVEVIDFLSDWNIDNLLSILDKFSNIEWIGISLTYSNFYEDKIKASKLTDLSDLDEKKFINYFRKRNIPIVLGGANADVVKNFVENYIIVLGYADNAIIKLHNNIIKSTPIKHETINNNMVIFSDRDYSNIELDNTETFYECNDYIKSYELLPIEISRGCIFKCKFCEFPYLGKKPGTYIRPKENIKSDILRAYTQFGSKTFLFVDDTFNDSIEKMQLIADIRKELEIPFEFWSYGRLDLLSRHEDMFNLIPSTGWTAITLGVETLNKKSGSSIGKGADPERQKNTLIKLRQTYPDLYLQANLIVGLPYSSKEDIKESIDWFLSTNVVNYLRIVPLDIRDPTNKTTGSEFSKNPNKFGYEIISTDSLRYSWKNNTWTLTEAQNFANEMNSYIDQIQNKKKNNLKSFHFAYHIKRFIKDGVMTRDGILEKLKNYEKELEYVKSKTIHLENL